MADSTISQLPAASSLSGGDYIPVDQGGVTKKASISMLGNSTVIIAPGKTLYVSNTLTLAGTDGVTVIFPSTNATIARTDAGQTFTGTQVFTSTISGSINGNAATSNACTGNAATATLAATATALATARAINGVDFDGTAPITVPVNNADDTTTNASVYLLWTATVGGNYAAKVSSTKLTFNPSTGLLTSTGFSGPLTGNVTGNVSGSSGSCTGNAATATSVAGGAANQVPYQTAPGTTTFTNTPTTGDVITFDGSNVKFAAPATSGTVTTVSVVSTNGFTGTVADPTTTPAITLTTSITGILKGNGTAISAASSGVDYGFAGVPQNSKSADYTTVLADAGKHILHPSADTTARTFTIDSNANVAYPVGATLSFVNQDGAGIITIAITDDTMRLAGAGSTGNRSLAANGMATALKITTTEWIINGAGLT